MNDRRAELLDAATDHVLGHGLIGLTLRPLAAAIGTSDRMLVYHFGSRDQLVSRIVTTANERAVVAIRSLPPAADPGAAVRQLWAAYQTSPLSSCLDVYCQAACEGLLGREPYLSEARAANERWIEALHDHFARSGTPSSRVVRVVSLVDAALYGFHLDLITDRPDEMAQGIEDLARAARLLADQV